MIPPMLEWYTWTVNVQIVHSISNLLIEHNKIHLWQTHMEDLYLVSNEWTNTYLKIAFEKIKDECSVMKNGSTSA